MIYYFILLSLPLPPSLFMSSFLPRIPKTNRLPLNRWIPLATVLAVLGCLAVASNSKAATSTNYTSALFKTTLSNIVNLYRLSGVLLPSSFFLDVYFPPPPSSFEVMHTNLQHTAQRKQQLF